MKFKYEKQGDILYGREEYGVRHGGKHGGMYTSDIRLTHMLDDESFAYHIVLDDKFEVKINGQIIKEINCADYDFINSFDRKTAFKPVFKTRQEALQYAIDVIYYVEDHNEVE